MISVYLLLDFFPFVVLKSAVGHLWRRVFKIQTPPRLVERRTLPLKGAHI